MALSAAFDLIGDRLAAFDDGAALPPDARTVPEPAASQAAPEEKSAAVVVEQAEATTSDAEVAVGIETSPAAEPVAMAETVAELNVETTETIAQEETAEAANIVLLPKRTHPAKSPA